jgi:hypothetical protein
VLPKLPTFLRGSRSRVAVPLLAALTALAACGLASPRTEAADPYHNSLDWVPADASAYSASFRLKEQIDIVAASNAWKKFREIPAVAQVWAMAEAQINNPEGPAAVFWQVMALPENQQMAKVLGEMFSDEIVFYAGADFAKFIELVQVMNGSRLAPMFQWLESAELGDPNQARLQMMLAAIEEDPELLNVPELTFAFRIKDREAATTQIARLEVMANLLLDQSEIGAKFERREFNDTEFLVLFLEGTMLPLPEETPFGLGLDDDTYEKLRDIIRQRQIYVAIGLWKDYIVLSIDNATEHLAKLGEGPAMATRAEFAALEQHRDRKLVGVSYVSKEVVASQLIMSEDLEAMAEEFAAAFEGSAEVPDELEERISADLREAAGDFARYLPTAGPASAFQFLTETGFEGFSYSWTQQPGLDGSKPLELAQHVGGSPILAIAARGVDDPQGYDLLAKWAGKVYRYVEDFAVKEMGETEQEQFRHVMDAARPLIQRFDNVTREKLAPALADGQSALVFDADIASKQWHNEMPASFEPLPMAELGIVLGVSDREQLVEAMSDYRDIINDAIDIVREHHPDEVSENAELPAPEVTESSAGTVYTWKLHSDLGLDPQVAPATAVNDHVGVIATSQALAERLLNEQPIASPAGALSDADQPRAVVVVFRWADLVSAVEPWVHYAVRHSMIGEDGAAKDPADDPQPVGEILDQVKTGLSILKCFQGVWAETTREGDAWVTHSTAVMEDLPE